MTDYSCETGNHGPAEYHLLLPLADESEALFFFDHTLPFLRSEGNLPALPRTQTFFIFYAEPPVEKAIRSHPHYAALNQSITIVFRNDPESAVAGRRSAAGFIARVHHDALLKSRAADAALVLLTPFLVLADGALARIRFLAEEGKKVVALSVPDATRKAALPLLARVIENGATLPPREGVRLLLDCIHPEEERRQLVSKNFPRRPDHLVWRVGDEGLIIRAVRFYPLMFYPGLLREDRAGVLDDDYCIQTVHHPGSYHFCRDSDEIFLFSLREAADQPDHTVKGRFREAPYANRLRRTLCTSQTMERVRRTLFLRPMLFHAAEPGYNWKEPLEESTRLVRRILAISGMIEKYANEGGATPMDRVEKAVVFGVGAAGRAIASFVRREGIDIVCFVDNNPKRWGETLMGAPVCEPAQLLKRDFDMIFVASGDGKKELFKQLGNMGFAYKIDFVHFLDVLGRGRSWGVSWETKLELPPQPAYRPPLSARLSVDGSSYNPCDPIRLCIGHCTLRVSRNVAPPLHVHLPARLELNRTDRSTLISLAGHIETVTLDTEDNADSGYVTVTIALEKPDNAPESFRELLADVE